MLPGVARTLLPSLPFAGKFTSLYYYYKFVVLILLEYILIAGNKIVISMMAAVDMAELLSLVGNVHSFLFASLFPFHHSNEVVS